MEEPPAARVASILEEASVLLGEGRVALRIYSLPVVEHVYLDLNDGYLVVTDDGETFGTLAGLHGATEEYVTWSSDLARVAARRFNVDLVDQGEPPDAEGAGGSEAFRLVRSVASNESVADAVQAIALAIDGVLALHTLPTAASHGAYFWDHDDDPAG